MTPRVATTAGIRPASTWEWGFSKPLAAKGGDRLVSCSYTDDNGWFIEIVGLLTPAR
jgi:hypothetical protein